MTPLAAQGARGWLQPWADRTARWSVIALGFSIPVSTALDSALTLLLLVAWLAAGRYRYKYDALRANPVALAAIALWLLYAVGVLWAGDTGGNAGAYLGKYSKLLLLPVVATLLTDPRDRERALIAFAAGLLLTLALSYALWLGLLTPGRPFTGDAANPTVFKKHITQNVLIAFGVLLLSLFAWRAGSRWVRLVWTGLALLAAVNVLFLGHGRTGYLVLAALVLAGAIHLYRWRGAVAATLAIPLTAAALYTLAPTFHERVAMAVGEAKDWDRERSAGTAVGLRLEYYHNTLALVRDRPLLGVGTGGFPGAYAERVRDTGMDQARNPHNQYLLTAAELGVVGLAAFLFFLVQHGRASARLPAPEERLLARGLLALMAVGCLFNSLLLDHTEGVFFVWLSGVLFAALPQKPRA
jgi:O-antigen ligase